MTPIETSGFTLADWFLRNASRFGDRPALLVDNTEYTYSQLSAAASDLAAAIKKYDPSPAHRLGGVYAYRSHTAYTGVLGTLFSGKGYVPLNPAFPPERNLRMLNLSGVRTIVLDTRCEQSAVRVLPRCGNDLLVLMPEHDKIPEWAEKCSRHRFLISSEIPHAGTHVKESDSSQNDIAYLLFTSGSTGIPKGVMVSHRNATSYVATMIDRYRPDENDRFSQFFDMTFDLSVHDMFVCWGAGACLCCIPEKALIGPLKFINHNALTFWFSVPSSIGFMKKLKMLKPGGMPSLKWSLFCGEPLPAQGAADWQRAAQQSIVENLYGPTEATIAITLYRWEPGKSEAFCNNGIVPIGRPFPGQTAVVVNDNLEIVPPGGEGELCVSGSQITPGYLDNKEETNKRFVTLPGGPPGRWYRTGDIVRWADNAGYIYLGRIDNQISIRGHRVELQEIEYHVRKAAGTDLAAVIGWPRTDSGADGIITFYSASATSQEKDIIKHCEANLPEYMVPREVHFVETIPLNENGKIDYRKLEAIRRSMDDST